MFAGRERFLDASRDRMRALAERLTSGEIGVREWQRAMRTEIADSHVVMSALGRGGHRQVTAADRAAIRAAVERDSHYLAGFAQDIAAGRLSPAQIAMRSELYAGANQRQSYAAARLAAHKEAGYTHKERVGPDDEKTCETCADEIAMGEVPIDEPGFEVGATDCQSNDRCEIVFSR